MSTPSDPSDHRVRRTSEEWRERLTPEQYRITREKGTEPAFTGALNSEKSPGAYHCVCCGAELFASGDKYDSGSGWPSFTRPANGDAVGTETDRSWGMVRTEAACARCDAHLGHVFPDGPKEPTGERWCINSASLEFRPTGDGGDR